MFKNNFRLNLCNTGESESVGRRRGDTDGEGIVRKTLCVQRARDGLLYIKTAGIFFLRVSIFLRCIHKSHESPNVSVYTV